MKTKTTDAFDFTIPHIGSVQPRQNWSLHNHEAVLIDLPLLLYRYAKPQGFHHEQSAQLATPSIHLNGYISKDSMRHWTEKGFQSNKQLEKKASTSSTSQLPAVIPAHSPSMISVGIV